jgi:ribosomal protein S18 acetylase RimI-like enzyme
MSQAVIRRVRSSREQRAYLSLVRAPYADSPYWVHPDVRILKGLLRGKTWLAARSEWQALLAEEGRRPVASLTAFLHRSFEEKHSGRIGTIGFFEALPGHEGAVDSLFREAERWLASRGATRVWGPINGHVLYGFGCLENRYAERPLVGTPYNPPEYPGHWWRQAYRPAPSFYSYRIDLTSERSRAAIDRALENPRLAHQPVITLRSADLGSWQRELETFCDLHNSAFADNWGNAPLSHAEIWELLGPARSVVDPELVWIAETGGKAVGLVLCMPDLNEVFAKAAAPPESLRGSLALLRHRRRITRGGLLVLGVLREARGRGLGQTLAARALKRMIARGMTDAEYCLVLESNTPSQLVARRLGGEQTKRYLMFEKLLG